MWADRRQLFNRQHLPHGLPHPDLNVVGPKVSALDLNGVTTEGGHPLQRNGFFVIDHRTHVVENFPSTVLVPCTGRTDRHPQLSFVEIDLHFNATVVVANESRYRNGFSVLVGQLYGPAGNAAAKVAACHHYA
jgi:hypothetical protein